MVNHQFDASTKWVHIPVKRRLPVMMRAELGVATAFEIMQGPEEPEEYGLLKAALKAKVFLLVDTLKTINAALGVELPKFPNGSGVRGSVIKVDHARCLVKFLFPDESEQLQNEIINSLAPPAKKTKKLPEWKDMDSDSKVMAMIAQLDPENAQAFAKISKMAKEELAETYRNQGAERLKEQVRADLEGEGLDIVFDEEKGRAVVKRKREPKDMDAAWQWSYLITLNRAYFLIHSISQPKLRQPVCIIFLSHNVLSANQLSTRLTTNKS